MAKAKTRKQKKAPSPEEEIELAHTGDDALARLREFTRVVVNVPPDELARAKQREEKNRGH